MDSIEAVRNLETELAAKKLEAAKELRSTRESLNLSLRKVAQRVKLTQGALHNLETGKSWRTQTVVRIARLYQKLAA